jgi:hypothetical protein
VQPDLDYEHEGEEKLELVALDWVPLRAGWLSYLHILRAIPNCTRFSVGESLVVCCGRDPARAGSIPRLWQTADLSGQNLRTNSGRPQHIDVRSVFLHIFYELRQVPPSTGAPRVGQKAPEFTLSDQDGKDVSLSDLVGRSKAVALIFYRGFW